MPRTSDITGEPPDADLITLLLGDVPRFSDAPIDPRFTRPFLFSAEAPHENNLNLVQVKDLACRFAHGIRKHGLQDGDHVMLISPNYITATVVAIGVIAAGGVFCAAQPDLKKRDYIDQFLRDEPRYILVAKEDPLLEIVQQSWKEFGGSVEDSMWTFDQSKKQSKDVETCQECSRRGGTPHWTELLATGELYDWRRFRLSDLPDTPCMLFTTSGTSGFRKAAIYSHRNLVATLCARMLKAKTLAIRAARSGKAPQPLKMTRLLHTISISRAMGTVQPCAIVLAARTRSIELYYMSKTYVDMKPYVDFIQKLSITDVSCAPFTLTRLCKDDRFSGDDFKYSFPNLRAVTSVGAPSSQSVLQDAKVFFQRRGAPSTFDVGRALGITEAGALVSAWRDGDSDIDSTTEGYQGRLESNMEVKIMTIRGEIPDGLETELPEHEAGEIYVRGPSVIKAYYKNEAASKAAFAADGWFRTGDVGYLDNEKLFLLDRKKDVLKTPDSIPPSYIEGVLLDHPEILDAAVIGIYDAPQGLQLVRAYLVKRECSDLSENDICAWMRHEVAETAQLTGGAEFIDRVPRNEGGKVLRQPLRELAAARLGRDVSSMTLPQPRRIV